MMEEVSGHGKSTRSTAAVACSSFSLKVDDQPKHDVDDRMLDFDYFWHVMNISAGMLLSLSSTSLAAAFPPPPRPTSRE